MRPLLPAVLSFFVILALPRARATSFLAPAAPVNATVLVWHHRAELRWLAERDGGTPTHYVVKWQHKGREEVHWHPDWVGVGSEHVILDDLFPGRTYAARIAAVNTQGRAWSQPVVFKTLAPIRCAESEDYFPLIDEADQHLLCVQEHADPEASTDPDARDCPPGVTEYLLAGMSAGITIALVAIAMVGKLQQQQPVPRPTRLSDQLADIDALSLREHDTFMQELRNSSASTHMKGAAADGASPSCALNAAEAAEEAPHLMLTEQQQQHVEHVTHVGGSSSVGGCSPSSSEHHHPFTTPRTYSHESRAGDGGGPSRERP